MNLNKTRIVVACAAAFAAQGAFAACTAYSPTAPEAFVNDCAPQAKLAIVGASSVSAAVTTVVTTDLFDTTSMPVITVKDTSTTYANNASNTTGWYGMSKASLTGGTSKRLFVVYNSNNGSAAGVSAILATKLDKKLSAVSATSFVGALEGKETTILTVGTAAAACTTPTSSTTVAPVVNCTSTAVTAPDVAFSDVHPTELYKMYSSIAKAKLTDLTSTAAFMQGFGVVVNDNLYQALQTKNVAEGLLPSSCTAGDTTAACQPSIRRAEYASIVTKAGGITSAAKLLGNSTTEVLTVARRDDLSGTQAASNIYFANNACGSNLDAKGKVVAGQLAGMQAIRGATDSTASLVFVENVTSSGVKALPTTGYALGVLSLNSGPTSPTRFVKLDGVSPNYTAAGASDSTRRARLINGDYGFQMAFYTVQPTVALDNTINGKAGTAATNMSYPAVLTALKTNLADSSQHSLTGIGYLDTNGTNAAKVSKVSRPLNANCAPLMVK
ncbi:MAG: hypothetical protein WCK07_14110 [Betaproteobacteria bacterium]